MIEEKMYTCTDFLKKLKSQIISIYIYILKYNTSHSTYLVHANSLR